MTTASRIFRKLLRLGKNKDVDYRNIARVVMGIANYIDAGNMAVKFHANQAAINEITSWGDGEIVRDVEEDTYFLLIKRFLDPEDVMNKMLKMDNNPEDCLKYMVGVGFRSSGGYSLTEMVNAARNGICLPRKN